MPDGASMNGGTREQGTQARVLQYNSVMSCASETSGVN